MALESISSNDFLNFMIYHDVPLCTSAMPQNINAPTTMESGTSSFLLESNLRLENVSGDYADYMNYTRERDPQLIPPPGDKHQGQEEVAKGNQSQKKQSFGIQGRKKQKKRRRPKIIKNKEEAETQRMTHIAVERNRRKQMNDHLAMLRSLMPESYVQRGDQASIVGGVIEYVKELEHLLQCLEAQKLIAVQQQQKRENEGTSNAATNETTGAITTSTSETNTASEPPFAELFSNPQYSWYQDTSNKKCTSSVSNAPGIGNIEVTLIETHANVRILSQRRARQIQKLVIGFQALHLSILHINITTLDPLVLYSISAKVEEECQLSSVDDIAQAVHHMIGIMIIEEVAISTVR